MTSLVLPCGRESPAVGAAALALHSQFSAPERCLASTQPSPHGTDGKTEAWEEEAQGAWEVLRHGVLGEERVPLGRSLPSGLQVPCLYHVDMGPIAPGSPPGSHPVILAAGLLAAPRACVHVE